MKVVRDVSPEADRLFSVLRDHIRDAREPLAGTPVAIKDIPTERTGDWQAAAIEELVQRGVIVCTIKRDPYARTTSSAVAIVEGYEDALLVMPVSRRPAPEVAA
jgi:hypothetical protein